jgi:hypothetical protein
MDLVPRQGIGMAAVLTLLLVGPASAQSAFERAAITLPYRDFVESWDEGFADGDPGEPNDWMAVCGDISDANVGGGALSLVWDPFCGGAIAGSQFGTPGPLELRASFAWGLPALGESFGISLANLGGTDLGAVAVVRDDLSALGLGTDTLIVALTVEPTPGSGLPATPVRVAILSLDVPSDLAALSAYPAIEFRLELTENGQGSLDPTAQYRLCQQADPCESEAEAPFQDLPIPAVPAPPPGLIPVGRGESHGAGFVALAPDPFTVQVLDARLRAGPFGDDFEDGILNGSPGPPYVFYCGSEADAAETGGALLLDRSGVPCAGEEGVQLGFSASFPGPQTFETTLRYHTPGICEVSGATLGSASGNFGLDTAIFGVTRFRDLGAGSDTDTLWLYGASEPEPGGSALPLFAYTTRPAADVADAALLELRLELVEDGLQLRPELSFRFCSDDPCPDEATLPFEALGPAPTFPGVGNPGEIEACPGLFVSDLLAPADGGAIDSPEPIGATLYTVPEPHGLLAHGSALLAVAALGRRRAGRIGRRRR